jgi:hypothetical protein
MRSLVQCLLLTLSIGALCPATASATTARALAMAEHVGLSDAVVEGRVVAQTRASADGNAFVDWTIEVDRTHRGAAPARIRVRQLGPDRVVVGDGRLAIGDHVVLFLRRGPHDRFYFTALAQSVYQVLGSGDAAPVSRDLSGLSLVRADPQGQLVPASPETPRTLEALRRAIREAR